MKHHEQCIISWGTKHNGKIDIVALAYNLSTGKAEAGENFCEFECSLDWLRSKFKAWLGCLARPCFKKGKITEKESTETIGKNSTGIDVLWRSGQFRLSYKIICNV